MKKETIILLGIGAAALFFLSSQGGGLFNRGRRRSGIVEVDSPEIISEDEFNNPQLDIQQQQGGGLIERGRDILDQVRDFATDPERQAARQQARQQRQQARATRRTQRQTTRATRRTERKTKQATRRAARQQRRAQRRRKVGDIPLFF